MRRPDHIPVATDCVESGIAVNAAVDLVRQTTLVSAVVSILVAGLICWWPRVASMAGPASLSLAFTTAWAAQPWTPIVPQSPWDWMPWISLVTGLLGVALAFGQPRSITWPLFAAVTVLSVMLAVPDFANLYPPRRQSMALVATSIVLLVLILERLSARVHNALLAVCYMTTGVSGAIVLAQSGSMKFAQICGMLTAALAGSLVWTWHTNAKHMLSGVSVSFFAVLVNLMFVGYADSLSKVPEYAYALVPFAPVVLWVTAIPSRGRPCRICRIVGYLLFTGLLGAAAYAALAAHPP